MFQPSVRLLRQETHARRNRNPAGDSERLFPQGDARQHQRRHAARTNFSRNVLDRLLRHGRPRRWRRHVGQRRARFVPGGVGRQDQRRDPPRRRARFRDRFGRDGGHCLGCRRALHPMRHRLRQTFDIGGQRRVIGEMIGRVIADDIDHRRIAALGVVDIGETVGETGSCVQQGSCRLVGHARIAVGRARDHALEQAEHAAHLRLAVERGDEMHFRCAGIGEADVDAARQQGVAQSVSAVHSSSRKSSPPAMRRTLDRLRTKQGAMQRHGAHGLPAKLSGAAVTSASDAFPRDEPWDRSAPASVRARFAAPIPPAPCRPRSNPAGFRTAHAAGRAKFRVPTSCRH